MTKYIYLFYILLGVCLLAGFGSAFDSGQEHDVVRTVGLENSAVALCNISESNNGQEKKEINNESYHFYKVGIGGTATSFSFRTLCSSKILRTHSSASVIAKLARFLKVLLPEEKQISFSPILYFTQYSSEYYIYQLRRVFLFSLFFFSARPIFFCLIFLLFLYFHNGNWGGCLFLL